MIEHVDSSTECIMKKSLLLIVVICSSLYSKSQVALYNEGGDGLTFYIGQDDVVQVESDVTNGAGATIEFENGGTPTLGLTGNFLNSTSGTYTLGTEKIEFNGSVLQTADFGGDNLYGLRTLNSENVQIDRHATIEGDLEFGTGDVNSSTSAYITLETSASASSVDDDGHNNGPIAKKFDAATEFTYPVGDGTDYRYATYTPENTSAVTMRSTYYGDKFTDWSYNAPIYKISRTEYWDMYRTSGTTDGIVTLSWDAKSGGVGTLADLVVAYYDGADWNSAGGNNPTGNTTAGDVESDASWSIYDKYFTLATISNDNTLPVELTKFEAIKENGNVRVDWETESEINSDYFSVQKSNNGYSFSEIDQVKAAGTSTENLEYFSYDYNPQLGNNYYKLINFDNDGTSEESSVRVINFNENGDANLTLNIYPNPTVSNATFSFYAPEEGLFDLKIYSITGNLVYKGRIMGPVGTNNFNLNLTTFESGKYIVRLISPSGVVINSSVEKI